MVVIGISGSIILDQGGIMPGYRRAYVNNDYVEAVIKAQGTPLILPIIQDEAFIKAQVDQLDALILSGGHDVTPEHYGEEPKRKLGDVFPERDFYDLKLIEYAEKKGIPILGICRGFQLLNVYYGGSLVQDLDYVDREVLKHSQNQTPDLVTHRIKLKKDSLLYKLKGSELMMVNSFHHQVLHVLGKGLESIATADDEVIEAFVHTSYPWLVGVQFHPEMTHHNHKSSQALFNELIAAAKRGKVEHNI